MKRKLSNILLALALCLGATAFVGCELDEDADATDVVNTSDTNTVNNNEVISLDMNGTSVRASVAIPVGGTITFQNAATDRPWKIEFTEAPQYNTGDIQPGASAQVGPFTAGGNYNWRNIYAEGLPNAQGLIVVQ